MAEMRCSISLVINGGRWLQEGEALAAQGDIPRLWSLAGLQDYVRLSIGGRLGHTLEQTAIVEQRWCRAKPSAADGEAVAAAAAVVTAPHVTADDTGAGLALEAVEAAALVKCDVMVTVGSQITWQPLRQKLEAAGVPSDQMAALLPGRELIVDTENETLTVTVDGRSATGTENRDKILKSQLEGKGVAIQAEHFLALNSKTEGRTLMKENEVIYIYHNVIDKTGDSAATESKTCDAVEQAFEELVQIIKKVAAINGSNMIITADHGFLYQDSPLDDASKSTLGDKPDGTLKAKKRYLLGQGIGESSKAWCGNTHVTAGTTPGRLSSRLIPAGRGTGQSRSTRRGAAAPAL